MCDIFGCCDKERRKSYEWLTEEDRPNAAAIEALRRQQYSRDIELPERVDRGGVYATAPPKKRFDTVLDLGSAGGGSSAGGGGGSVYKRGDRQDESEQDDCEQPAKQSPPARAAGGGQRLGGDAPGTSEATDAEAHAKASEAALKRLETKPQGFSANGALKLKQAAAQK